MYCELTLPASSISLPVSWVPLMQCTQGVYQDADGALLHAFSAGDGVRARCHAEVGGEEAHGCAGGVDVYHVGHVV